MLQLEREQYLVNLARIGFFGRQVDVARDLHGDRRRALALEVAQIGQSRAHHALVVDAAMFVKTRVFDCQYGVGHDLRHVLEPCQVAPLFAEFADQQAIR